MKIEKGFFGLYSIWLIFFWFLVYQNGLNVTQFTFWKNEKFRYAIGLCQNVGCAWQFFVGSGSSYRMEIVEMYRGIA